MQEFSSLIALLLMLITDPRTSVLFALLVTAAVIDYRTYKIPNWLTMPGAAFGLAYAVAIPFSSQYGFMWAAGGLVLGLLIMLPLYMLKVMGAGDVKLMAMAGTFLGVSETLNAALITFIVGGVAAVVFAMFHGVLGRMLNNIKVSTYLMLSGVIGIRSHAQLSAAQSVGKLPYGVSISIGIIGYVVAKQLGYL